MKKIVGILAAAALATSAFAADVSATAKLSSNLFTSKDGAIEALTALNNAQTADYATLFNLSVSTDKAGGGVKYWAKDNDVTSGAYNVWFKPTDAIKLSFKENGLGLFGQKYKGYYAHEVAKSAAGYGFSYAADAIALDIVLEDGFLTKAKDADATLKAVGAKFGYSADFGSIAFLFSADNTFKKFQIGAGFSGNVGDIGVVFNAGAIIDDGTTTVGLTPSAGGSIDALSWAIDIPVDIILGDKTTTKVGTLAKVTYALDAFKVSPYFEDEDFLAEGDFAAKIGVAFEGNVGSAAWKVDPNFTTKDKAFTVAFETSIGF